MFVCLFDQLRAILGNLSWSLPQKHNVVIACGSKNEKRGENRTAPSCMGAWFLHCFEYFVILLLFVCEEICVG